MSLSSEFKLAWNEVFRNTKESVILHSITPTWDANDDIIRTSVDTTINARMEILEQWQENEFGGVLRAGDAIGYLEPTTVINVDDTLTQNSITYRCVKILPENMNGTIIFQECWFKRIHSV